jgi:MOB kinase activator 1
LSIHVRWSRVSRIPLDRQERYDRSDGGTNAKAILSLDYTWLDANKKPMRLPAPTYIEYVMQWISNRINDETLFPTKSSGTTTATTATPSANRPGAVAPAGAPGENWVGKEGGFPQVFEQTCRGIYKQMFRVFAHIYHTHFDKILHMSLEAHFNSLFVHFIHFSRVISPRYGDIL